MHAYSQDLRQRVLRALARGDSPTLIARCLEVSRAWIYQVSRRLADTGKHTSLPMGGHRKPRLAGLEDTLRTWIKAEPDLILAEMCARLEEEQKVKIGVSALWHQLDR